MPSSEQRHGYMRPYVNLAEQRVGPLHVRDLSGRAGGPDRGPADAPLPSQVIHPAAFRRSLAAQLNGECAVDDPRQLPESSRTAAWSRLVDMVEGDLGGEEAAWAADLLFRLGFFRCYVDVLDKAVAEADERWAPYLQVLGCLARERIDADTAELRGRLEGLRSDHGNWGPARLLAASSLIVGAAKAKPCDKEMIAEVTSATEGLAREVERSEGGPGLLFASTFWRAASFVPHHAGDLDETLSWLDHSRALANRAASSDRLRLPASVTAYPVIETRARVLRLAGRGEDALADLRTLSALDPFDARVYLKLGETYGEVGRTDDAVCCYDRAAKLGPPLAPLAHLHLARSYREGGNLERARGHIREARRLDPTIGGGQPAQSPTPAPRRRQAPEVPVPLVEPDQARAQQILDGTAGKRQRMLEQIGSRLLEAVPPEQREEAEVALARAQGFGGDQRRRLLCGPAFSVWLAESIRALQGHVADTSALGELPRIIQEVADREGEERPRLRVGRADPLLSRFVDRSNAEDRERGGPGDVAVTHAPEHVDGVKGLVGIIQRTWPEAHAETGEFIQDVLPFTSDKKTALTNASLHGLLFLRVPFENEAVALDRFAHEAAHVLLNLVLEVAPCHEGHPGASMPSPFRDGLRPVEGVLHGVYVFARAAETVARSLGALDSPAGAVARIRRSMALITSGLVLLEEFAELNDFGRSVAEDVRRSTKGLIEEFGLEQF